LIDNQLHELIATTAYLQEESERLEREARQLVNENIQVQIEARLLKEKYRHRRGRRQTFPIGNKRINFSQLKQELRHQRRSFLRFERRLQAKYEQPLREIVANTTHYHHCRRIRSMPSESID
jgi:hypothetical protein